MQSLWRTNWPQTQQHFISWWQCQGLVLGSWGTGLDNSSPPHSIVSAPPAAADATQYHTDPDYVAQRLRYEMSRKVWPADILPAAWPEIGTVSIAPCLGAAARYSDDNVWYQPCITDPQTHPPLRFDPAHPSYRILEALVRRSVEESRGNYLIGMPAIISNLDVLAELRGIQNLLLDMIERPDWVHEKLQEIEIAYYSAFNAFYELIKAPDGSMAFGYFMLWGPGKTGLLQCDAAALFSPRMFEQFVIPYLRQSVRFLDYSMFHIDGHQCLAHLDYLLELEGLDAIEWTPDPKVPPGGSGHWYDLYRKILAAKKAVWVANIDTEDVLPLLDAIGAQGVYLNVVTSHGRPPQAHDIEQLSYRIESYRTR
ncbi:MAG: uroporphyrinogen decarboxylase family protein [Planctomycetaceae bacterium]|nr:uroporphyrinogen decarboxylase family protein [Planctomycetaceae bacterium]